MSEKFGLELVLELYNKDFERKSDALVALLHWALLNGGLRCVGKGEHFGGNEVIFTVDTSRSLNIYIPKFW